jgi:HEAT repeat protein
VAQRRFLQEARLASNLSHPNLVYLSDFGVLEDGRSYIVMEFLEGPTLHRAIARGPFPALRAVRIALQMARGLQAVHERGIVHRDLKPENVFLLAQDGQTDFVKIVDFGIALAQGPAPAAAPPLADPPTPVEGATPGPRHERHTLPGMVLGTPEYMAPEQAEGQEVDGRADQYALGCILYEMLTGVVPFDDPNPLAILFKQLHVQPVAPSQRLPERAIPAGLEALLLRMLEKRREERFASMREVEQALRREEEALEPAPHPLADGGETRSLPTVVPGPRPRPWLPWLVAPIIAAAALGGAYLLHQRLSPRPRPPGPPDRGQLLALRQEALAVIRQGLLDPDPALRALAVAALGPTRDLTLRRLIEPALADNDPQVQARAAEAMGQLGDTGAAAALRGLAERTLAGNPAVAVAAAAALDQLGDAEARGLLRRLLSSRSEPARLRAALLLGGQGDAAALDVLTEGLQRPGMTEEQQQSLLFRLAQGGSAEARDQLRRRSESGRPETRLTAAAHLMRLGDARAREQVRESARKAGPEQLPAGRVLAATGETDEALAGLFRQVLRDPRSALPARVLSIEALGLIGGPADVRLLQPLLQPAHDPRLRLRAAGAILLIASSDPAALSERSLGWARAALGDESDLMREVAVAVLGDIETRDAVALLAETLTRDRDPTVRRGAARALGRQPAAEAVRALEAGLADADAGVRREALAALARLGRGRLSRGQRALAEQAQALLRARLDIDQLVAALADAAPAVRLAAAQQLAALADRRAVPVLREALAGGGADALLAYGLLRRLGEAVAVPAEVTEGWGGWGELLARGDLRTRLRLLDAAAELPAETALPLLRRLRGDPSAAVAARAAALLARQAATPEPPPEAPAPEPPPAARPDAGAADLRAPPDAAAPADAAAAPEAEKKPAPEAGVPAPAISPVLADVRAGMAAFQQKDFAAAQRLLTRANTRCARERDEHATCAGLAFELSYYLGRMHEQAGLLPEAMTEYDRAVRLGRGPARERAYAREAMRRLLPQVGHLVVSKVVRGRCQRADLWVRPGEHQVELGDGRTQLVQVAGKQTVQVEGCW